MHPDTERSCDSVASGMAWAPVHMQTASQHLRSGPAAVDQGRIPGAYMQTRSLGHLKLELDQALHEVPANKEASSKPLGALLEEITRMSMLFCGRAAVGQWRKTRQCSGNKVSKQVASKLPQCAVLGIDDGLERLLVTGKAQDLVKDNGRFTLARCTRLICLPGVGYGTNVTPMDLTDCMDVKCKGSGKRMRVEMLHADGRSLWLYNVGTAEYRAITESLSACRTYAQIKKEKEEAEQASAPSVASAAMEARPPEVENSVDKQTSSQKASSPSKRNPVPKLCLDGIGNYPKPSVQSVPLQIQQHEVLISKESYPSQKDIAVAQPENVMSSQPLSVSSAVRAAEALIESNGGQLGQNNVVTATTGHVYVQGGGALNFKNPISRIKPGQLEEALQTAAPTPQKSNWLNATRGTPPIPPPIASHAHGGEVQLGGAARSREAFAKGGGAAGETAGLPRRAVPQVASGIAFPPKDNGRDSHGIGPPQTAPHSNAGSSTMANGQSNFLSPPPRRLPRLHSMSPEKPIVADPGDIQTALDNFDSYISESKDGNAPPALIYGLMRERGNHPNRQQVVLM